MHLATSKWKPRSCSRCTAVRRRDAVVGGLIGSIAFELGKRGFALYVLKIPTYKAVYGAFAVFPVFLLWVYFSWLVTLAAALITANLSPAKPRARGRRTRPSAGARE